MKGIIPSLKRASPTILSCIAAIGTVATAVLAVKATPKAIEYIQMNTGYNHLEELHPSGGCRSRYDRLYPFSKRIKPKTAGHHHKCLCTPGECV